MIDASVRLRRAIHLKDVPLVQRIVNANPKLLQNPDFADKSNTSLHLAAQAGLVEIAELLLNAGHEANEISRNADWDTPLMIAAQHGHVDVGKLLIDRCSRSIPLTNRKGLDALAIACRNQASTSLIPILLSHPQYPASIHSCDIDGNTPLHHASASGSLKALRILLIAGADPFTKNAFDWTPLAYSQTVAAEVYFKNIIAELERRKIEEAREEKERKEEELRRRGAGVRLITADDIHDFERPTLEQSRTWSPVEKRRALTPTVGRSAHSFDGRNAYSFDGTRARAKSGD